MISQLFLRVVGSSGRSYIFKFEVPFLVLPQNKSRNDIQRHKTSKLNFKTRMTDSDDESEMRSGDSGESKRVLRIASNNKISLFLMHGFSI